MLACCLATLLGGCASFSNPVADGIPVRRIPAEYLAKTRNDLVTIPLTALRQEIPPEHKIGPGDILGIYIPGIVPLVIRDDIPLPVREQQPILQGGVSVNLPPAVGYPIPVSADGTIPLPQIPPIKVEGLTLLEAEAKIKSEILKAGKLTEAQYRALITIMRPRQFQIQVLRQETPQSTVGAGLVQGVSRKGTATYLDLPVYQNDVLNALTRTGGLPGLDAVNEILVYSSLKNNDASKVTRIPVRLRKGQPLPFKQEDVVLQNGDVVFIEARETEVYYIGGLTNPKQYTLPRDYDLTVTAALAVAGGPIINGGFNQNNLQGAVIQSGLGSPSPSQVSVMRRTKDGGQMIIVVNVNKAMRDPRENLVLQPGDFLVLQETLGESLTRYLTTVLRYNGLFRILHSNDATINSTLQGP